MSAAREELAGVLDRHVTDAAFDSGCRLSCGYSGDDLTEHMADAIIASDWLKDHDKAIKAGIAAVVALTESDLLRGAVEAELIHKDNYDFIDRVEGFIELFSVIIREALSDSDGALASVIAAAKADAWDEGHSAGAHDVVNLQIWNIVGAPNPYRKADQ